MFRSCEGRKKGTFGLTKNKTTPKLRYYFRRSLIAEEFDTMRQAAVSRVVVYLLALSFPLQSFSNPLRDNSAACCVGDGLLNAYIYYETRPSARIYVKLKCQQVPRGEACQFKISGSFQNITTFDTVPILRDLTRSCGTEDAVQVFVDDWDMPPIPGVYSMRVSLFSVDCISSTDRYILETDEDDLTVY